MAKSESWKQFSKDHFEVDPFKTLKILKGNRKNNTITCLQNMDGQLLTNERQILKTLAETFFPQLNLNSCHTLITLNMQYQMTKSNMLFPL